MTSVLFSRGEIKISEYASKSSELEEGIEGRNAISSSKHTLEEPYSNVFFFYEVKIRFPSNMILK